MFDISAMKVVANSLKVIIGFCLPSIRIVIQNTQSVNSVSFKQFLSGNETSIKHYYKKLTHGWYKIARNMQHHCNIQFANNCL